MYTFRILTATGVSSHLPQLCVLLEVLQQEFAVQELVLEQVGVRLREGLRARPAQGAVTPPRLRPGEGGGGGKRGRGGGGGVMALEGRGVHATAGAERGRGVREEMEDGMAVGEIGRASCRERV